MQAVVGPAVRINGQPASRAKFTGHKVAEAAPFTQTTGTAIY